MLMERNSNLFGHRNLVTGLCDIYKEQQSDEDENYLLVESECVCRKLDVYHALDESTKNLAKMQSKEAELKHKSRRWLANSVTLASSDDMT
ncbi:hypothetical protein RIF29_29474 [Crotalaria pallida]|uniref:Uncharacterized protein n=1 Tax=Crotalaria pallida TaxID=3830 RepID=A0AAN9EEX4_CROPI